MSKWDLIKQRFHAYDKKNVLTNAFALGLILGVVFSIVMLPVTIQLHSAALAFSAFLGGPMAFAIGLTLSGMAMYLFLAAVDVFYNKSPEVVAAQVFGGSTTMITKGLQYSENAVRAVSDCVSDTCALLSEELSEVRSHKSDGSLQGSLGQAYEMLVTVPSVLFWGRTPVAEGTEMAVFRAQSQSEDSTLSTPPVNSK